MSGLCAGSYQDLDRPHDAGPIRCQWCGCVVDTTPYGGYLRNVGSPSCRWVECVRIVAHDHAGVPVGEQT